MYKIILQNPDKNIYCVHLDTVENLSAIADALNAVPEIDVQEWRAFHTANQSTVRLMLAETYSETFLKITVETILANFEL